MCLFARPRWRRPLLTAEELSVAGTGRIPAMPGRVRRQRPAVRHRGHGPGRADERPGLFDLGTNGEIAVGQPHGIVCASTAAGPAFEGGRIGAGNAGGHGRHRPGGDSRRRAGLPRYRRWRGARHLRQRPGGCGGVRLGIGRDRCERAARNADKRLAAGRWRRPDTERHSGAATGEGRHGRRPAHAGAAEASKGSIWRARSAITFGRTAPATIGLLPDDLPVKPAGNSALRGARMLLLAPSTRQARLRKIAAMTRHIELASDPDFQDMFAERMAFTRYRSTG